MYRRALIVGLVLVLWSTVAGPAIAGTFTPSGTNDITPDSPIATPGNTRYISGVGNHQTFTLFYEDRDESGPAHVEPPASATTAWRINRIGSTSGPAGLAAATPGGLVYDELSTPAGTFSPLYETHFLVKD